MTNSPANAQSSTTDYIVKVSTVLELKLSTCNSTDNSMVEVNIEPTVTGTFRSNCQEVFINTNAPGYTLTARSTGSNPNYNSGTITNAMLYTNPTTITPTPAIPSTTSPISTPTTLSNDTWGFAVEGLNPTDSTSLNKNNFNFNSSYTINNENNTYASLPTTDTTIYHTDTFPLPETNHLFYYAARLTPRTDAGSYATTITYTAVGEMVEPIPAYVDDGLILHYDGINNTGVGHSDSVVTWVDLTGNNNYGTLEGSNVWDNDELVFDGSTTGVLLPSWFQKAYNSANTLEVRFKADEFSSRDAIISNYSGVTTNSIAIERNSSSTSFQNGETRWWYSSSSDVVFGGAGVTFADTYYTMTLVFDKSNSTTKLYLNGNLAGTSIKAIYSTNIPDYGTWKIGRDSRSSTAFKGTIQSVRFYDTVLSVDDILQNYNFDLIRFGP